MIKILQKSKYDKMQYDKLFNFFYHIQCSKYDKNIHLCGSDDGWCPPASPED